MFAPSEVELSRFFSHLLALQHIFLNRYVPTLPGSTLRCTGAPLRRFSAPLRKRAAGRPTCSPGPWTATRPSRSTGSSTARFSPITRFEPTKTTIFYFWPWRQYLRNLAHANSKQGGTHCGRFFQRHARAEGSKSCELWALRTQKGKEKEERDFLVRGTLYAGQEEE